MSQRILKDWLKAYMQYSAYSEAPDDFHFWTGVSVIAGALRRRVWIEQGYFQWTPNFYIIFVAPPGIVAKSTTASIGMNLLRELPDIAFGPNAITWQSLVQSLAESSRLVAAPDETFHTMSCLTIVSSEFGTFLNPNDREMVDILVELWDGQVGTFEKKTKTQGGDAIHNPWLNILACTTPEWISGTFPEYLIGGGFTSRCVFVYGEKKRQLVAYPGKSLPKEFLELRQKLIRDLEVISTLFGEFQLSPDAVAFGEEWYQKHYSTQHRHLDSRFGGYLARKQTHIHKLAMVISAAKKDELVIEKQDLETAVKIVDMLEANMPRVFDNIGKTDDSKRGQEIVDILHIHGTLTRKDLYAKVFRTMSWQDYEIALRSAVNAGRIKAELNEKKEDYLLTYLEIK